MGAHKHTSRFERSPPSVAASSNCSNCSNEHTTTVRAKNRSFVRVFHLSSFSSDCPTKEKGAGCLKFLALLPLSTYRTSSNSCSLWSHKLKQKSLRDSVIGIVRDLINLGFRSVNSQQFPILLFDVKSNSRALMLHRSSFPRHLKIQDVTTLSTKLLSKYYTSLHVVDTSNFVVKRMISLDLCLTLIAILTNRFYI